MTSHLQIDRMLSRVQIDSDQFYNAQPFRHLVLDDLIPEFVLTELVSQYPDADWQFWEDRGNAVQALKLSCRTTSVMPSAFQALFSELQCSKTIRWLERLTGIKGLLPDPHLFGAGLHCTLPGGSLDPHADFPYGETPGLRRRLTLVIYLSEFWEPNHGGLLDLWRRGKISREIEPVSGRAVLIENTTKAVHGISKPVQLAPRASAAIFYYDTVDPNLTRYGETTVFWSYVNKSLELQRGYLRLRIARSLMAISRLLFKAHERLYALSKRVLGWDAQHRKG